MKKFFAAAAIALSILVVPAVSFAALGDGSTAGGLGQGQTPGNGDYFGQTPDTSGSNCGPGNLCNPLGSNTICGLLKGLLDAALVIGIPIAVLFIIFAGFKFVTAQGASSELAEAKKNFFNVIVGVAIFVGASLIATVIINTMSALGVQVGSCFL